MSEGSTHLPVLRVTLIAKTVAAYVANNLVRADDVAGLIDGTHGAFLQAAGLASQSLKDGWSEPVRPVRSSIKPDHLACLEDGGEFRMLKRHLMSEHGMTPEQYRARWNLRADYPMAASDYTQPRSKAP